MKLLQLLLPLTLLISCVLAAASENPAQTPQNEQFYTYNEILNFTQVFFGIQPNIKNEFKGKFSEEYTKAATAFCTDPITFFQGVKYESIISKVVSDIVQNLPPPSTSYFEKLTGKTGNELKQTIIQFFTHYHYLEKTKVLIDLVKTAQEKAKQLLKMVNDPRFAEGSLKLLPTLGYSILATIIGFQPLAINASKPLCFEILYRFCKRDNMLANFFRYLFDGMSTEERNYCYQMMLEHFDDNNSRFVCFANTTSSVDGQFLIQLLNRAQTASEPVRIETAISVMNTLIMNPETTDAQIAFLEATFEEYKDLLLNDFRFLRFLAWSIAIRPDCPRFSKLIPAIDPQRFIASNDPVLKSVAGFYFTEAQKTQNYQLPGQAEAAEQLVMLRVHYLNSIKKIRSALKMIDEIFSDPESLAQLSDDLAAVLNEAYQFEAIFVKMDVTTFKDNVVFCKRLITQISQQDPEGSNQALAALRAAAQNHIDFYHAFFQ